MRWHQFFLIVRLKRPFQCQLTYFLKSWDSVLSGKEQELLTVSWSLQSSGVNKKQMLFECRRVAIDNLVLLQLFILFAKHQIGAPGCKDVLVGMEGFSSYDEHDVSELAISCSVNIIFTVIIIIVLTINFQTRTLPDMSPVAIISCSWWRAMITFKRYGCKQSGDNEIALKARFLNSVQNG